MTFLDRILGRQPREMTDSELEALCHQREEADRKVKLILASLDAEARSRGSR